MANNIWVLPEKYGYIVHFKSYQVVKNGRQVVSSSKWGLEEKVLWLIECLPLTVSYELFMNNLFKIKTQQWYLDNGWSERQQGSLHSSFLNLLNLTDLFGFWTKLNESIFKKNNQINSIVTTRTWVLSTEWTSIWSSTGLVFERKNIGEPCLFLLLFLKNSRMLYRIRMRRIVVSTSSIFSKRYCQYIFSEICKRSFSSRVKIRNVPSDVFVMIQTLPGAILKTRLV